MERLTEIFNTLNLAESARQSIAGVFTNAISSSQTSNSQAAINDEVRTVAAVLKPTKPKPYSGAVDAVECLNFIENQEEYFKIVSLNPTLWVRYTAVNLEGDAKAWWRDSNLDLDTPWVTF
ncbi:hypothetical protein BGZ65_008032, partial [Modicella reniformis]